MSGRGRPEVSRPPTSLTTPFMVPARTVFTIWPLLPTVELSGTRQVRPSQITPP